MMATLVQFKNRMTSSKALLTSNCVGFKFMVNSRRYRSTNGDAIVLDDVSTPSIRLSAVVPSLPPLDFVGANDDDDDDEIPPECVSIRASKYGMSNASHIE